MVVRYAQLNSDHLKASQEKLPWLKIENGWWLKIAL